MAPHNIGTPQDSSALLQIMPSFTSLWIYLLYMLGKKMDTSENLILVIWNLSWWELTYFHSPDASHRGLQFFRPQRGAVSSWRECRAVLSSNRAAAQGSSAPSCARTLHIPARCSPRLGTKKSTKSNVQKGEHQGPFQCGLLPCFSKWWFTVKNSTSFIFCYWVCFRFGVSDNPKVGQM